MSDSILFIDGLPHQMGRGGVFKLLIEQANVDKEKIGRIVVNDGMATAVISTPHPQKAINRLDGATVEGQPISAWLQTEQERLDDYFANQLRWLTLEARAEAEQYEQGERDSENSLTNLVIQNEELALGGRVAVRFAPRNQQQSLPWSKLSVGTPILLLSDALDAPARGVISQLRRRTVEVVFNQPLLEEGERPLFTITRSQDQIGRQRMEHALHRAASASENRLAELRDIILGTQAAQFDSSPTVADALTNPLNPSQQDALRHALSARDIALIHGPPGTGKTTTVVALIRAAVAQGERVLACAPSHVAVDNLCEPLAAAGVRVVRLGHPARIADTLLPYTLDAQVAEQDSFQLAKKMRKEAAGLRDSAGKWRRAKPERGAKQAMHSEASSLLAEARELEQRAVEQVFSRAEVVLSTLTGLDGSVVGQRTFDLCVIDEAGQATQPAAWLPILRANRIVLAGDHLQLPPTILSQKAEREGFGVSLLERLMGVENGRLSRRLTIQYRMNEAIMRFSSDHFYGGTLVADASVASRLLGDLVAVGDGDLGETAVLYIDTAGASYDESLEPDGNSRLNEQEAALLVKKVETLRQMGVIPDQIGIITPYSAQVRLLREQLGEAYEIFSVDGFQGREKEVILISLVRSNDAGDIGFLAETRRMNVALTRARRLLIVIGDSATVTANPFFAELISHWEANSAYRSVWEEIY